MAYAFLRFLFGADEFVNSMCALLHVRRQAQAKHALKKELAVKLDHATEDLEDLKRTYQIVKAEVERGYALEFVD